MHGELDIVLVWYIRNENGEIDYDVVEMIYTALMDAIIPGEYLTANDIYDWLPKTYPGSIYTANDDSSYIRFSTIEDKMHFLLTYC